MSDTYQTQPHDNVSRKKRSVPPVPKVGERTGGTHALGRRREELGGDSFL
jgi:hypothetical protein